jgi:predicted RNA-binding protein YlxR (DUF448 family)
VTIRDDVPVVGDDRPAGRSAYLCPTMECFEAAVARRAFSRALRRVVEVDEEFRGRITDACAMWKGGEPSGTQDPCR